MAKQQHNKFFQIFLLLFVITGASAADNTSYGAIGAYSFENFPQSTVEDYSAFGNTLTLYDINTQINNTAPKIGNWGANIKHLPTALMINGSPLSSDFNLSVGTNFTISMWFKPSEAPSASAQYALFTIGAEPGSKISAWIPSTGRIDMKQMQGPPGDCANAAATVETASTPAINSTDYYHLVFEFKRTTPTAYSYATWINNVQVLNTSNTGTITTNIGNTTFAVGKLPTGSSCSTSFGASSLAAMNKSAVVDQILVYNRSLSYTEISSLYNNGTGFDPFDVSLPEQIASIGPLTMSYSTTLNRDFGQYYTSETWIELGFEDASSTRYIAGAGVYNDTYTGASFAIQFTSATSIIIYSFDDYVASRQITTRACNNYGCTPYTNTTLSIGVNGTNVFQIGSVAPISTTPYSTIYRTISDYFDNHENIFVQYTNPDNFSTVYVTEGYPENNSCAHISVLDDNVIYRANGGGCTISNMFFIVDDNEVTVTSNAFSYTVTSDNATTGATGTVGESFAISVNAFSGLFPYYETISFKTRMTYVMVVMLLTLLGGAVIAFYSGAGMWTTIGTGATLIMEVVYFTSIKYIPVLLIALFAVIITLLGIAWFTRQTTGGGN